MAGSKRTYTEAAHAMQTGVAMKMQLDPKETEPKHLRVGINSAMCDTAAIARLLVSKGVFTEAEFTAALTEQMNQEADSYEKFLRDKLGAPVTLG